MTTTCFRRGSLPARGALLLRTLVAAAFISSSAAAPEFGLLKSTFKRDQDLGAGRQVQLGLSFKFCMRAAVLTSMTEF